MSASVRKEVRALIYARDQWQCAYCGAFAQLTLDHIRCVSDGGEHKVTNLLTCCYRCNTQRGNTPFEVWVGDPARSAALYRQARLPLPTVGQVNQLLVALHKLEKERREA